MTRLEEIRARLDKATPGPWEARVNDLTDEVIIEHEQEYRWQVAWIADTYKRDWAMPDADLIANAPADLAWALSEIERLSKIVEDAVKVLRWDSAACAHNDGIGIQDISDLVARPLPADYAKALGLTNTTTKEN